MLSACGTKLKHKLKEPALSLSLGDQQKLCIARAISVEPEVILFDEPCSALDPVNTLKIEELMWGVEGALYNRDCHPQYAAGGQGFGLHHVHAGWAVDRIRPDK